MGKKVFANQSDLGDMLDISGYTPFTETQISRYKRYSIIDQQVAPHFVHYSECLSNPLPFYATQIINPFLTLRISANKNKRLGF